MIAVEEEVPVCSRRPPAVADVVRYLSIISDDDTFVLEMLLLLIAVYCPPQ